jgi:hypothetical protein
MDVYSGPGDVDELVPRALPRSEGFGISVRRSERPPEDTRVQGILLSGEPARAAALSHARVRVGSIRNIYGRAGTETVP